MTFRIKIDGETYTTQEALNNKLRGYAGKLNFYIPQQKIGTEGAKALATALMTVRNNVTEIDLDENNIGDDGARALADALRDRNCSVTNIDLRGNNIDKESAKALADALRDPNCSVTSIRLWGNNIGDDGARALADALRDRNCSVTNINLRTNNIGDDSAKALAEALRHPDCNVTNIRLGNNNIGTDGAKALADALRDRNCHVTNIDIHGNNIGDDDAKALADALRDPNCSVTNINLGGNTIGDDGAYALAAALGQEGCKVETIDLDYTGINDTLKDKIHAMARLSGRARHKAYIALKQDYPDIQKYEDEIKLKPLYDRMGAAEASLEGKAATADLNALKATVDGKATTADLNALKATVDGKASKADLNALKATVDGKASKAALKKVANDVSDLAATVDGKATTADIDALKATVDSKASTAALEEVEGRMDAVEGKLKDQANASDLDSICDRVTAIECRETATRQRLDAKVFKAEVAELESSIGEAFEEAHEAFKAVKSEIDDLKSVVQGLEALKGAVKELDLDAAQTQTITQIYTQIENKEEIDFLVGLVKGEEGKPFKRLLTRLSEGAVQDEAFEQHLNVIVAKFNQDPNLDDTQKENASKRLRGFAHSYMHALKSMEEIGALVRVGAIKPQAFTKKQKIAEMLQTGGAAIAEFEPTGIAGMVLGTVTELALGEMISSDQKTLASDMLKLQGVEDNGQAGLSHQIFAEHVLHMTEHMAQDGGKKERLIGDDSKWKELFSGSKDKQLDSKMSEYFGRAMQAMTKVANNVGNINEKKPNDTIGKTLYEDANGNGTVTPLDHAAAMITCKALTTATLGMSKTGRTKTEAVAETLQHHQSMVERGFGRPTGVARPQTPPPASDQSPMTPPPSAPTAPDLPRIIPSHVRGGNAVLAGGRWQHVADYRMPVMAPLSPTSRDAAEDLVAEANSAATLREYKKALRQLHQMAKTQDLEKKLEEKDKRIADLEAAIQPDTAPTETAPTETAPPQSRTPILGAAVMGQRAAATGNIGSHAAQHLRGHTQLGRPQSPTGF